MMTAGVVSSQLMRSGDPPVGWSFAIASSASIVAAGASASNRSRCAADVTISAGSASRTMCASSRPRYSTFTGTKMTPSRRQASNRSMNAGPFARCTTHRSPRPSPRARSNTAIWSARASTSPNVSVARAPSARSYSSAGCVARPARLASNISVSVATKRICRGGTAFGTLALTLVHA